MGDLNSVCRFEFDVSDLKFGVGVLEFGVSDLNSVRVFLNSV